MSDTPRNNKLTYQAVGCSDALHLLLVDELSRNLERELAAVTQELAKAQQQVINLQYSNNAHREMAESWRGAAAERDVLRKELADARRHGEVITQECAALRRAMAEIYNGLEAVYLKYKPLNYLQRKDNLDPWHACARDLWRAVKAATGQ